MSAKVTREHRIDALRCLCVPQVLEELGPKTRAWVDTGFEHKRHDPAATLVAQAIADAEARGRASVVDTELAGAERALVEATLDWQEYDRSRPAKDPGFSTVPWVRWHQAVNAVIALRAELKGDNNDGT